MEPVINIEEKIGKTVGRRRAPDPLKTSATQIAEAEQWLAARGRTGMRKGVYRYKTHEEANASWIEEILRAVNRAKR